jgi:hypothetical protein
VRVGEWLPAVLANFFRHFVSSGNGLQPLTELYHNQSVDTIRVYDIQVADHPEFYANGVLVHNCPICAPLGGLMFSDGAAQPASIEQQDTGGVMASIDGGFVHPGGLGAAGKFAGRAYQEPPAHPRCRCSMRPVIGDVQPAAVTPEPVVEAPVEWQPSMSREQAERWAAGSQYQGDVYHVTPGAANARSIMEDGFDLSKRKFGRMWGDGVYVSTDEGAADTYRRWTGRSAKTMTIKADVRNMLVFDLNHTRLDVPDVVAQGLNITRKQAEARLKKKTVDELLKDAGYDALQIIDRIGASGGNQVVVFDPRKVTVISD